MLMFVGVISYAQQYQWTGASGDIDFFNELNWKDTSTSEIPSNNSIKPSENIEFEHFISCEVSAENEIILGENGKIIIIPQKYINTKSKFLQVFTPFNPKRLF